MTIDWQVLAEARSYPNIKSLLIDRYYKKDETSIEIGGYIGATDTSVRNIMKALNLPRRQKGHPVGAGVLSRLIQIKEGDRSLLTAEELAKRVGAHPTTVRRLMAENNLAYKRRSPNGESGINSEV